MIEYALLCVQLSKTVGQLLIKAPGYLLRMQQVRDETQ